MNRGKLVFGLIVAATLSTTGCAHKSCGGIGTASAFPPAPCNTCPPGCPTGGCGGAPGVAVAPVQAYSAPPAAVIPNGYAH